MPELAETVPWPDGHPVVLITTPPGSYKDNLCRLIRSLRSKYGHGVIITANRPYHVLAASLQEAQIDLEGLEFIDCISALTGHHPAKEPGVTFVEGPLLLEMIVLRTQQLAKFMPPGNRFVLMDSISTLKLYNGVDAVTEMAHALSSRMRLMALPTALLALQDGENALHQAVVGYCDQTLEL